jgi:hypothetical protein
MMVGNARDPGASMAYNRNTVRNLLSASEMELFEGSLDDKIGAWDRTRLRNKITRSRKLRDKYRDLYRRQSLSTRDRTGTKRGPSGLANERSQQKHEVFAEVLTRYERQLEKLERAGAREAERVRKAELRSAAQDARAEKAKATKARKAAKGRKGGRTTTPRSEGDDAPSAPGKGTAGRAKTYKSEQALAARNAQKLDSPRGKKVQAHVRSQGQRNQAKRDSR